MLRKYTCKVKLEHIENIMGWCFYGSNLGDIVAVNPLLPASNGQPRLLVRKALAVDSTIGLGDVPTNYVNYWRSAFPADEYPADFMGNGEGDIDYYVYKCEESFLGSIDLSDLVGAYTGDATPDKLLLRRDL